MLAKYNDSLVLLFRIFSLLAACTGILQIFSGKQAAEALQTKIATLEKRQAVRELSAEQIAQLSRELALITKPSQPIYLMGLQGNVESINLAKTLSSAFAAAGFKVNGPSEEFVLGGTGSGITVRHGPVERPKAEAIALVLERVGLLSKTLVVADRITDSIDVIVGYKPSNRAGN